MKKSFKFIYILLLYSVLLCSGYSHAKIQCENLDQGYLKEKFNYPLTHISFVEMVNARQVTYPKGTKVEKILLDDQEFSYEPLDMWTRRLQAKNGILTSRLQKDMIVYLPFCQEDQVEELVSMKNTAIDKQKKKINKKLSSFTYFGQYGKVESKSSTDQTLKMSFIKLGLKYSRSIFNDYQASITGAINRFTEIDYSNGTGTRQSSFLPELNLSILKSKNNFSYGVGYDYLHYFSNGEGELTLVIEPTTVHRLTLKASYFINKSLIAFSNLGYLSSLGDISGKDLSLGLSHPFGAGYSYALSLVAYQGIIATPFGEDTSRAIVIGLSEKI